MDTWQEIDAGRIAHKIIETLLEVKPNEKVLIIADTKTDNRMVTALAGVIQAVGAEFLIEVMSSMETGVGSHTTLPEMVRGSLKAADVIIAMNKTSVAPSIDDYVSKLLHEKKIRLMSMALRSMDNWTSGAANADYYQIYKTAERLVAAMRGSNEIEITTSLGTNLRANIKGRPIIIEAGFARGPGESAAFSDGEISVGPMEGTAEGTLEVDGPVGYHLGRPTPPAKLTVKDGRVVKIEGGGDTGRRIEGLLKSVTNLGNIAEVGIGLNPMARKSGDFHEEKKALGNVHVALGDNIYYYGNVKCDLHIDLVMYEGTVIVDSRKILENSVLKL